MAEAIHFRSDKDFENWLEDKPVEWAQILAFRIALRVLPLTGASIRPGEIKAPSWQKSLLAAVFRCTLLLSAAQLGTVTVDNKNWNLAARAARAALDTARAALDMALDTARDTARETALDARAAARAARAALDAALAARAARAAARAALDAALGTLDALDSDAQWLDEHPHNAADLVRQPLLPDGAPDWFLNCFNTLAHHPTVASDWGFKPWLDWFVALLPLDGYNIPHDYFGPAITRRIINQPAEWWEKDDGVSANRDIAHWLEEEKAKQEPDIIDQLPPTEPTGHVFAIQNGKIVGGPLRAEADDPVGAHAFLAELTDKVEALAEELAKQHNLFDDYVLESVAKLRNFLPAELVDLNPYLLQSRLRAIKEIAEKYHVSTDIQQAYPAFRARIGDLAYTGESLEMCLKELKRIELEKLTRSIPEGKEDDTKAALDAIVMLANADQYAVDGSAKIALSAEKAFTEEKTSPIEKKNRLGEYGLAVRNFLRPAVQLGLDIATESRPKLVAKTSDAMGDVGKLAVFGGIAALITVISGPVMGVATLLASYGKIDEALKLIQQRLKGEDGA